SIFGAEVGARFQMEWRLAEVRPPRVAILASNTDHCLLELLWRWRRRELAVEIPLVIANHETLRTDVQAFGIAYHALPVTPSTKAQQEAAVRALLREAGVELVVLARYMQILSADFIAEYPARIINIHHSFLPAFAGADPYGRAFERGVKIIGATAHYATAILDEGPIIEQDVVRVTHRDGRADLVRLGREVERSVLARAVQWHIEDRVFVHENRTVVFR
ncbi:MAG: formyltetrahydrofolate deformylase, partial [Dehalococcoidia bacterium]|nr:formyltetrahydrofolate deformylase [Dehalococcoidia bacterium]